MKNTKTSRSESYLDSFRQVVNDYHKKNNLVVFTDGSADNMKQSEPIKFGFLIYEKGKLIHSDSQICNDTFNTSIKSELMAVNFALGFLLLEGITNEDIILFSDNKWLVEWAVNKTNWYSKSYDKAYYESFVELRELMSQLKSVKAIWIPREVNGEADKLTR